MPSVRCCQRSCRAVQRRRRAAPSLRVVAGLGIGLIPGVPAVRVSPDVVSFVVLPPLLYAATEDLPWRDLRPVWRPVTVLAVGQVLASAGASPRCTTPAGSWRSARRTASGSGTWRSLTRRQPGPTPSPVISGRPAPIPTWPWPPSPNIAEADDRDLVLADLETIPGQPRYWR
ncbi:MAG: hypothetical protein ACLQDY_25090 [Streptosporangiaceae bacterium]